MFYKKEKKNDNIPNKTKKIKKKKNVPLKLTKVDTSFIPLSSLKYFD